MLIAAGRLSPRSRRSNPAGAQGGKDTQRFKFRTGVELINVTATVTDSVRPLRAWADQGRLPRLRRRRGTADFAFQQRTRPGQPRNRPRHERQHERREDPRRTRGARIGSSSSCSTPSGRSVSVSVRQRTGTGRGMDAPTSGESATRSGGSSRAAAPPCTTRSPKQMAVAAAPDAGAMVVILLTATITT